MFRESFRHVDFQNEGTTCWIKEDKTSYTLYSLETQPSKLNQGHASALLEEVKLYCKEKGKPVKLFVKCYYHRTKDDNQLIRWYAKNGFRVDNMYVPGCIWMVAS